MDRAPLEADEGDRVAITEYVPERSAQIIAWLTSLNTEWRTVHAIELHDTDRDSALALQSCFRSGLVQRRRLVDIYSEQMAAVVIEATETGNCNERHIAEQAAKLWPLANSVQGRPEWQIKLTADGCQASNDIASGATNARSLACNFATFKKAAPDIRVRIVGQGGLPPAGVAVAAAQATASIGNITIENHIVVPQTAAQPAPSDPAPKKPKKKQPRRPYTTEEKAEFEKRGAYLIKKTPTIKRDELANLLSRSVATISPASVSKLKCWKDAHTATQSSPRKPNGAKVGIDIAIEAASEAEWREQEIAKLMDEQETDARLDGIELD